MQIWYLHTVITYWTSSGAEIDLLPASPGNRLWAIEIKRGLDPHPEKGFHFACRDLGPERKFVVYPGEESFPVGSGIQAMPVAGLARLVSAEGF